MRPLSSLVGLVILAGVLVYAWLAIEHRHSPLVEVRLPLVHNLLVEPLDSDQASSLRVLAMPNRALRDSLARACAEYRWDSAALAGANLKKEVGQVWRDRWRDMTAVLARRIDEVRPMLVTDSAVVSRRGLATLRLPALSRVILVSRTGVIAAVLLAPTRSFDDQLAPLGALCGP